RIEISRNDQSSEIDRAKGLMVSAFLDTTTRKTVLVAINYSENNQQVHISAAGSSSKYKIYQTSQSDDLAFKGESKGKYEIPARSVVTFVEK
ncbi:MAG: glycoside hydrolase family 30 beta sandwich domain-containing protein, partial [Bacteroidota bacterium]|nr:glycoside hydrolase family 30 beta sandwich domain-containing protein [Bacteroidota bacterium]